MENLTQILEAILFASGTSKKKSDILALLPNATKAQFDKSVEILKEKYSRKIMLFAQPGGCLTGF